MRVALVIIIGLFSSLASAQSLTCDGATASVIYGNKEGIGYESVDLTIKNGSASVKRQYEYVWFSLACLPNASGKKHLVYQAYCGGSACRDLDNWGIIDPVSLKVLLEPTDDNRKKAIGIMGPALKPLPMR